MQSDHASDYPELPQALSQHNVNCIGPDTEAMHASWDKIMSTLLLSYTSSGCTHYSMEWNSYHHLNNINNKQKDSRTYWNMKNTNAQPSLSSDGEEYVPNTGNITATINDMLSATKSNNNENNTDALPPNNSPKAID
eukprot:934470_1